MAEYVESTSLWVFGYGSLCWHPGFQPSHSCIGHVKNFVRRFWQGNTTHRGLPGKPGRVATLIPKDHEVTWGVAHQVTGEKALEYLNTRECNKGGYSREIILFYPEDPSKAPFPVLTFIATKDSKDWIGPSPLLDIAGQIVESSGPTGHNVEYLLRLAEFMKEYIPAGYDEHLEALESLVRLQIKMNNLSLKDLMGEPPEDVLEFAPAERDGALPPGLEEEKTSYLYCANIPTKKLRCVNL